MRKNPEDYVHLFRTFLGLPPDSSTPPLCGARLSPTYSGHGKPPCSRCARVQRQEQRAEASLHGRQV